MNSLGHNATPTEIEDLINDIDLDQSGTLDLDGINFLHQSIPYNGPD